MDRKPSSHETQSASANTNGSTSTSSHPSLSHSAMSSAHDSHSHKNLSVKTESHAGPIRRATHMDRRPYARPPQVAADMPSPNSGSLPRAMQAVNLSRSASNHHLSAEYPPNLEPMLPDITALTPFQSAGLHSSKSKGDFPSVPSVWEKCPVKWDVISRRMRTEPGWTSDPPRSPHSRRDANHQSTSGGRYEIHNPLYVDREHVQAYQGLPSHDRVYSDTRPPRYGICLPVPGSYAHPPPVQRSSSFAGQGSDAGYWQSSLSTRRNTHNVFGSKTSAAPCLMGPPALPICPTTQAMASSSQTVASALDVAGPSNLAGPSSSTEVDLSLAMANSLPALSSYTEPMQVDQGSYSTQSYTAPAPVYDQQLQMGPSSSYLPRPSIVSMYSASSGYSQLTSGSADADGEYEGANTDQQVNPLANSQSESFFWNLPYQTGYVDPISSGGDSFNLLNNIAYPMANMELSSGHTRDATVTAHNFGSYQGSDGNMATDPTPTMSRAESAPAMFAPEWLAALQNMSDPSSDSDDSMLSTNVLNTNIIEEAMQLAPSDVNHDPQTSMFIDNSLLLDPSIFVTNVDPSLSPVVDMSEFDAPASAGTQEEQVSQAVVPPPAGLATPSGGALSVGGFDIELSEPNAKMLLDFISEQYSESLPSSSQPAGTDDCQNPEAVQSIVDQLM